MQAPGGPSSRTPSTWRTRAAIGILLCVSLVAVDLTLLGPGAEAATTDPSDLPAIPSAPAPPLELSQAASVPGSAPSAPKGIPRLDEDRATIVARGERFNTYRDQHGTLWQRIYTSDVNYKDSGGRFRPIDTTVVEDEEGGFRNAAGPARIRFGPKTGSGDLVRVDKDGWSIGFRLSGTSPGKAAKAKGSEVTYASVAKDLDLTYRIEPTSLKEYAVLKAPPGGGKPVRLSFPMTLNGLTAREELGGITLYDEAGERAARIPPGIMLDSIGAEHDVDITLSTSGGTPTIEVTADGAWLSHPDRIYPVRIDPSVRYSTSDDTFASEGTPTTNSSGREYGRVGWSNTYKNSRTFMKFTQIPSGQNITSARLQVYFNYSVTNPAPTPFYIKRVTSGWSSPNLTWVNQPTFTTSGLTGQAAQGEWSDVDLTGWVRNWVGQGTSTWTNYGLVMVGDEAMANYKRVTLAEDPNPSLRPYLEVGFGSPPNPIDPSQAQPTDGATVLTSTPRLQVPPATDPDGDPVRYWFQIATGANAASGQLLSSGWITQNHWDVPKGALRGGVDYAWVVYLWDGSAMRWPEWVNVFTVDLGLGGGGTHPTDTVGALTANLASGNLSLSYAGPSLPAVGGTAGVSFSYDSANEARRGLRGEYWSDVNANRAFDDSGGYVERIDPQVNLWWSSGTSPYPSITSSNFLARFTGEVAVPTTGTWYFGAAADDGVRIWVDGTLVVDRWFNQPMRDPYYGQGSSLTAGQRVPIRIEYYNATGTGAIRLAVRGPGVSDDTLVPTDWLFPEDEGALPPGWSLSDGDGGLSYASASVTDSAVTLIGTDGYRSTYKRKGSGFTPPRGEFGFLATDAATGNLVLHADDGLIYTFASDGRLLSAATTTDDLAPAALVRTWSGDPPRLAKIADPVSGRDITLHYAPSGCPSSPPGFDPVPPQRMLCRISYWDGTETRLFYASGQLARIEERGGEITDFGYDASGRLSAVRDPLAADAIAAGVRSDDAAAQALITYDAQERVGSIELPAPTPGAARAKSSYSYGAGYTDVDVAGMSGSAGYDRRVVYDAKGRLIEDRGPDGLATTFTWDDSDRPVATTDPTGRRSTTIYDADGLPTSSYGPAPTAWFGSNNRPLAAYTSQVPREETRYDEGIRSLAAAYWTNKSLVGQPKCHETGVNNSNDAIFKNWGSGSPNCLNQGDGWSARYTGDVWMIGTGNYVFNVYADGGVRLWVDDVLIINSWTDSLGWKPAGTFNNTVAGARRRIRLEYFENVGDARLELHWDPSFASPGAITGDFLRPRYGLETSRIVHDAQAGSLTTSTVYAQPHSGLPTAQIQDPNGLALSTQTTYEAVGTGYRRQKTRRLPAGNQWTYSYYGDSETLASPPCGIPSGVPQAGFLRSRTGPDPDGAGPQASRVEEFAYDAAGRQVAFRIAGEEWSCTTFDDRGRVVEQTFPAFGGEPARTVSHDHAVGGNPLVSSVTDAAGTITATVDLLGRVVSYTDVWGMTTTYTYDQAGRVVQSAGPAGVQELHYESGTGRLASQALDGETIAVPAYDPTTGELQSVSYPAGEGDGGNGTSLSQIGRNQIGEPTSITWLDSAGGDLATDQVTRSQSGRVIDQSVDGADPRPGAPNFVYDAAGRLTAAWVPGRAVSYQFAASGGCGVASGAGKNTNRTAMSVDGGPPATYCYDHADRLTSTTDPAYPTIAYDSRGNTTTLGDETLSYDGADRHLETTKGSTTVRYLRDATDRIIERRVNGAIVARYGYTADGDSASFTLNASNQVIERTISLPGGVLLTKRVTEDVWSYPNIHGDVFAVADASGAKQGPTLHYDPYGEALTGLPDNSAGSFDYGWLGQHQRPVETESGISAIQMGARPYVTSLGRFLQVDPVEGGSANDYDYVAGDPINLFDLDGLAISCAKHADLCSRYRSLARSKNIARAVFSGFTSRAITILRKLVWAGALRSYGLNWFTDGCSSVGWLTNVIHFGLFGNACGKHDFGYRNARAIFGRRSESDRARIDSIFLGAMLHACNSTRGRLINLGGAGTCQATAYAMYRGVRYGARGAYRA